MVLFKEGLKLILMAIKNALKQPLNPPRSDGTRVLCQPNANSLTKELNNLITKQPINTYISKDFDVFWQAFPKKKKKEDARKAWNTIRPNIEEVLKAIEWQKQSPEWFKQGGQFIPYPATWIRSHSWEDEKSVSVTFQEER